jgi:3-hydroxyisobutyrate dehydrogenase-like beta-hydroxyacid dehydrogenase
MQLRTHDCYFSATHAEKDSAIALDLAQNVGLSLPVALATLGQYRRLLELGKGDLDKSAVAELTFPDRTPSRLLT